MTLEENLRTGITDLPISEPKYQLENNGWHVDIHMQSHDAHSGLFSDVTIQRDTPLPGTTQKAWAEQLANRVTGLHDPLKVHEVDSQHERAWLRSAEPTKKGDAVQYYEAELHGTQKLRITRQRGYHQPDKNREQVSFPLTYESLAKLVDDLTGQAKT